MCCMLAASCKMKEDRPETQNVESIEIKPEVVFDVTDDQPLRFYIESRGIVEPLQKIQITPRISGFVEEHNIVEGRQVQKGQLLVKLSDDEWKFQEKQAYNDYLKNRNEYTIETKLRKGNGSAEAPDSMVRILTGLSEAELAYKKAKLDLSYAIITAPFAGIVSTKNVLSNGAYITAGEELGSLIDAHIVHIRFDVLESEVVQLKKGVLVELTDASGQSYNGNIIAVSPEIDPETKTGQAVVEVGNPEGTLKIGMTVEGQIFVGSRQSKARLPRAALLERDGRTLVFKLQKDEVEWIYVTPVAMNNGWFLVDNPDISPGDTIAVDKHFSISHQQKVIPLMVH